MGTRAQRPVSIRHHPLGGRGGILYSLYAIGGTGVPETSGCPDGRGLRVVSRMRRGSIVPYPQIFRPAASDDPDASAGVSRGLTRIVGEGAELSREASAKLLYPSAQSSTRYSRGSPSKKASSAKVSMVASSTSVNRLPRRCSVDRGSNWSFFRAQRCF